MSTLAFIASMKLTALREQRDTLAAEYQAIVDAAAVAESPAGRLRALHDGLRDLRLAGDLVHPHLPDVSATLNTLAFAAPVEIDRWIERLGAELERGRARSEAVYAFGALLEESSGDRDEPPDVSGLSAYLEALTGDPGPEPPALAPEGLLDRLFDAGGYARMIPAIARHFEVGFGTYEGVPHINLWGIVNRLLRDRERDAGLRAEAKSFADEQSEAHVALRDALEISLAEPSDWRWPHAPLALRPVATADRVRFHPELDLVALLVLELLGQWIGDSVPALRTGHVNRRQRIDRLVQLEAPDVIIANERRLLERELGLLSDPRVLEPDTATGSVAARRDLFLAQLWSGGLLAGSHYSGYASDSARLVRLLGAELAFHRAGDRPFYAVRADVAECFASIDHRVIASMLERLEMPAEYRALVARYLAAPLPGGPARRGLPLGLSMSRALADLVLGAVELHVRRAGVLTARVVDDIAMWSDDPAAIAAGYAALLEALDAVGLRINPAKTGAVAAGAELPGGLPEGAVRFNLLVLEPGGFAVDQAALADHIAATRDKLDSAPSLLAAARAYNHEARFLLDALVAHPDLPGASGDHLAACGAAVQRFADGVEAWLEARIAGRCGLTAPLPRAWLYWPVSAGGLGLRDAMLELGAIPTDRREPPDEPRDELASNEWGAWYQALIDERLPRAPRESAVSKAQVDDFIARGGELRGQAQEGLGVYWLWVLATHGPEILERFGTFRFLLRKLVPLDLLSG
jgi:hypothetical protein